MASFPTRGRIPRNDVITTERIILARRVICDGDGPQTRGFSSDRDDYTVAGHGFDVYRTDGWWPVMVAAARKRRFAAGRWVIIFSLCVHVGRNAALKCACFREKRRGKRNRIPAVAPHDKASHRSFGFTGDNCGTVSRVASSRAISAVHPVCTRKKRPRCSPLCSGLGVSGVNAMRSDTSWVSIVAIFNSFSLNIVQFRIYLSSSWFRFFRMFLILALPRARCQSQIWLINFIFLWWWNFVKWENFTGLREVYLTSSVKCEIGVYQ